MFDAIVNSIRKNHFAQMAVCCTLPVVLILALPFFGFTGAWIYPLAIFACVGSHLAMGYFGSKEGKKACH